MFIGESRSYTSSRCSLQESFFVLDFAKGALFASFLQEPHACFIGSLTLGPQKNILSDQIPKVDFIFYSVLEGTFLVTLASKEHLLRQGDCLAIHRHTSHEIYNPHQFNKAVTLVVTFPSFIYGRHPTL